MADASFDVVSKVDKQEVSNALTQAQKEISQRYDFKNIGASIEWSGENILMKANSEERVLAVLGSAYLQNSFITPLDVWASIPVGCLVTAILIVNNLRDIDTDRRVGKMTLAVRLGRRGTRLEYALCVAVAYGVVVGLGLAGMVGAWWWLPLLSLPLAVWLVRCVARTTGRPLNNALKRTGQLHLLFGLLFAAALWLG